jgi:hypothetical protein
MTETKSFSLVKPTLDTPFHIDFSWWKVHDSDWRVYLQSFLCQEHQAVYSETTGESIVDWVDPETAEVFPVDGLQQVLMTHCALQSGFLEGKTLVDSVFRTFLSNGNSPLNMQELGQHLNQPANKILITLSSGKVYKGIRPILVG